MSILSDSWLKLQNMLYKKWQYIKFFFKSASAAPSKICLIIHMTFWLLNPSMGL